MNRVMGIYQSFLALSLVFFIVAGFICISLLGFCAENWLERNVVIGCIAELILVICGILLIRKGSSEILSETHSLKHLKMLYENILFLTGFGVVFSLCMICFHYAVSYVKGGDSNAILIYAFNIIGVSLIFFIWMTIRIHVINKITKC